MPNQNARELRKNMTDAERAMWRLLRQRQIKGLRFRRQVPIDHYIADFACLEVRLIIEVDGGQHYDSPSDRVRDCYLQSQGFQVLRFWNNDVLSNPDGVYRILIETVEGLNDAARARLTARHPPSTPGLFDPGVALARQGSASFPRKGGRDYRHSAPLGNSWRSRLSGFMVME